MIFNDENADYSATFVNVEQRLFGNNINQGVDNAALNHIMQNYYMKSESDSRYISGGTVSDFSNYYNIQQTDTKFQKIGNYLSGNSLIYFIT